MFSDLKLAARLLAKSPGFTFIAIITLAVGIGSATVVFSAINALLLKPLPLLHDESRLLFVTEKDKLHSQVDLGWNYADFLEARKRMTTLEGLWGHSDRTVIIAGANEPVRVLGTDITWDAFNLMGVQPILGHNFIQAEGENNGAQVALISHALWQSRFGGDPSILNSSVPLNGQPVTIIGVMPPVWRYPDTTDVWTPLRDVEGKGTLHGYFWLSARAKMKPGVTLAQVQAEGDTVMAGLAHAFATTNSDISVKFSPIREEAIQDVSHLMLLLFGGVACVFLIACVNVANLLLARGATRAKELAIRLALGAKRPRVVRQLVTESLLLGLLGGVGGLILGLWGTDAMVAAIPVEIPFWLHFDFDGRVFGFVFGLSLVASLAFGLVPALKASRPDVVTELKEGGRSSEEQGPRSSRLRSILVVTEVALALVLLVGAGLLLRSFLHLRNIDPGFNPHGVLSFRAGFPPAMVGDDKQRPARFFDELVPRLAALPGVESVGLISNLPGTDGNVGAIAIEGQPEPKRHSDAPLTYNRLASPTYFATMGIPLKAGRLFDDALNHLGTPRVAVVDEGFAMKHFGGNEHALGQRFRFLMSEDGTKPEWVEIIGVVGNIRHRLDRDEPSCTAYLSQKQEPSSNFMSIVMRTKADPSGFVSVARDTVLGLNHDLPIYYVLSMDDVLLRTIWQRQFFSYLFTVFGGVALFLACIGIYGVMSYSVAQRTQEIGVRMALGAQPTEVIGLVVRSGLKLVSYGLGAGFIAAFLFANLLAGNLYGVSPHDPPTFTAVPALLAVVALFACWLPSRRATRIDPMAALRGE